MQFVNDFQLLISYWFSDPEYHKIVCKSLDASSLRSIFLFSSFVWHTLFRLSCATGAMDVLLETYETYFKMKLAPECSKLQIYSN